MWAERVETRMLIITTHGKAEMMAAYARQLEEMREDLGANCASAIEKLLIERVVLTWARLQYVEEMVSYTYMPNSTKEAADHWDKRLTRAQSRFLKACATLARTCQLQRAADKDGLEPISAEALVRGLRRKLEALEQ
jgi:hypothetical protein